MTTAPRPLPPVSEATREFRARMVAKAKSIAEQLAAQTAVTSSGDEWVPPVIGTQGRTSVDGGRPYVGELGDRLKAAEEAQAAQDARQARGAGIDGRYLGPLAERLKANDRAAEAHRRRLEPPASVELRCPCGVPLVVERGADVERAAAAHGWVRVGDAWACSLQHASTMRMRPPARPTGVESLGMLGSPPPANPRGRALWESEQDRLRTQASAPATSVEESPPAAPPADPPRPSRAKGAR